MIAAATLPTWDLRDLYPSRNGPELPADLDRLTREAQAFHRSHAGLLRRHV